MKKPSDGSILLLAKRAGETSFASLYRVKRALGTRKVGHTGTLDSFATGLLVVCAGRYTRLVPYITQADKTYEAVIEFGYETDTLEWTGVLVRKAQLPALDAVEKAIKSYVGGIMQCPPQYSAIHVAGRRASDIARSGGAVEIPQRKVSVYRAKVQDVLMAGDGVKAVKVLFAVSKGTYIRALARDIGSACGSAASLAALRRTAVGPFRLEDAALVRALMPFTIENALRLDAAGCRAGEGATEIGGEDAAGEILQKAMCLTPEVIKACGIPLPIAAKFAAS